MKTSLQEVCVGIAEMKFSSNPQEYLVARSLGSCVGVAAFDPVSRVGGMIHCLLPLSTIDQDKAALNPCMFVDTGLVLFLNKLIEKGAQKSRLIIKAAGAGAMMDTQKIFNIGQRNFTVCRKVLWKNDLVLQGSDVNGLKPKTLILFMDSGKVIVKTEQIEKEL